MTDNLEDATVTLLHHLIGRVDVLIDQVEQLVSIRQNPTPATPYTHQDPPDTTSVLAHVLHLSDAQLDHVVRGYLKRTQLTTEDVTGQHFKTIVGELFRDILQHEKYLSRRRCRDVLTRLLRRLQCSTDNADAVFCALQWHIYAVARNYRSRLSLKCKRLVTENYFNAVSFGSRHPGWLSDQAKKQCAVELLIRPVTPGLEISGPGGQGTLWRHAVIANLINTRDPTLSDEAFGYASVMIWLNGLNRIKESYVHRLMKEYIQFLTAQME
ncbi:hypothetical protein IWQ61_005105 [Dispira simplex]|nr:hypothetical protein IWQ61_005105 [Dispira simplex]